MHACVHACVHECAAWAHRYLQTCMCPLLVWNNDFICCMFVGLPTNECLHCYAVAFKAHNEWHMATCLRLHNPHHRSTWQCIILQGEFAKFYHIICHLSDSCQLKRGCIEFKYYADTIHSGLTPPRRLTKAEVSPSLFTPLSPSLFTPRQILYRASLSDDQGSELCYPQ